MLENGMRDSKVWKMKRGEQRDVKIKRKERDGGSEGFREFC